MPTQEQQPTWQPGQALHETRAAHWPEDAYPGEGGLTEALEDSGCAGGLYPIQYSEHHRAADADAARAEVAAFLVAGPSDNALLAAAMVLAEESGIGPECTVAIAQLPGITRAILSAAYVAERARLARP